MKIMKTYCIAFYDHDEERFDSIDSTEFCGSTPLEARLTFIEWALTEYWHVPQIVRVSQVYNADDELEYNSEEWPDFKYDASVAPDEEENESDYERVRNELLTSLYCRMLTRGATKEEVADFVKVCENIDNVYSSVTLVTMFSKYGYIGKEVS